MQHPDEGTIHSWLDGALSADEAARVATHVKDCPECAAAVAEARGFIAASSRILTALDNAPRGVIPATAPKKRVDRIVWRVAATLLVVAGGTFVVLRNGGKSAPGVTVYGAPDSAESSASAESAAVAKSAASPITIMGNPARPASGSSQANTFSGKQPPAKIEAADRSTAKQNARAAVTPPVAYSAPAAAPPSQANRPPALFGGATSRVRDTAEAGALIRRALTPAPAGGVATLDSASEPQALRLVGTARQIGAKTTLYEVAPGDTVTLTEIAGVQLESVVVTGAATVRTATQPTGKSVTTPAAKSAVAPAVSASDSQGAAGIASPAPAQAVQALAGNVLTSKTGNVQVANGVTTIRWTDPATGNVMKLSGRISPARLQQVKTQIERERAAEAAKKKP
jgi:Putative zinc-finger